MTKIVCDFWGKDLKGLASLSLSACKKIQMGHWRLSNTELPIIATSKSPDENEKFWNKHK